MKLFLRPLVLAALLAGCATRLPDNQVQLNLVAMNDFHGHLEASRFGSTQAGGIDTLAGALQAWRREDPDLLLVGAGDMVGASPALSAMWADEPTIEALNQLGMRVTSVGNHEFDQGRVELLRQAKGGCNPSPRPDKACKFTPQFEGAQFSYLAANVIDTRINQPLLPAYRIEEVKGVKVAFIGTVLKDAADLVASGGVSGLQFIDEAQAVNRLLPELRAKGATVFVVLIHQGGSSRARYDQQYCDDLKGNIVDVVKRLDPAIRLVVSGHTHNGYLCRVDGRLVTQAEKFGHVLSRITLVVDRQSGAVVDASARNVLIEQGKYSPTPQAKALLASVRERSSAALNVPVAHMAVPVISRRIMSGTDESPLGQLVADALLSAGRKWGAQIAFTNQGGLRTDLESSGDNMVTSGHVQASLPFGNDLVIINMSGAQILALLEAQWSGSDPDKRGMLQVSESFSYSYDARKPWGQRIVRDSVRVGGMPLDENAVYRIALYNYLADGNDGFATFRQGSNRAETGVRDADALRAYLAKLEQDNKPAGTYAAVPRILRIK